MATNLNMALVTTTTKPNPPAQPPIFYSLSTPHDTPRTLVIHLEIINSAIKAVLECQTHSLTMHPERSSVVLEVTSDDGVRVWDEIMLLDRCVVCIDFIPRVFNSVYAMYAVSRDQVAILMQPYSVKIKTLERPIVDFTGGLFEDPWNGRIRVDPYDGNKGDVEALHGALQTVFGAGTSMRWGFEQISPFPFPKEEVEEQSFGEADREPSGESVIGCLSLSLLKFNESRGLCTHISQPLARPRGGAFSLYLSRLS